MKTTFRSVLGTLVAILLSAGFSVAAQTPLSFPGQGRAEGAAMSSLGPEGWYSNSVRVELVNKGAWLNYDVTVGDTRWAGGGFIPTEAFRIDGKSGSASLSVDTSALVDFQAVVCVTHPDGSYECSPHGGGLVLMEWTANGAFTEEDVTQRTMKYSCPDRGVQVARQILQTWMTTASAQGTVLGHAIATPPGDPQAASVGWSSNQSRYSPCDR
jgi:hypothetical protein